MWTLSQCPCVWYKQETFDIVEAILCVWDSSRKTVSFELWLVAPLFAPTLVSWILQKKWIRNNLDLKLNKPQNVLKARAVVFFAKHVTCSCYLYLYELERKLLSYYFHVSSHIEFFEIQYHNSYIVLQHSVKHNAHACKPFTSSALRDHPFIWFLYSRQLWLLLHLQNVEWEGLLPHLSHFLLIRSLRPCSLCTQTHFVLQIGSWSSLVCTVICKWSNRDLLHPHNKSTWKLEEEEAVKQ